MIGYFWASAYSLLDLLKYLLCLLFVFGVPIYKKKITISIWLTVSIIANLIYFSIYHMNDNFFIMPNICSIFLIFIIKKKARIKGFLFILLTWAIMDSLSELIKLLLSALGGKSDYLLGFVSANTLLDKILVLFFPLFYHIIVNMLIKKKVEYALYPSQWIIVLVSFVGSLLIVPSLERIVNGESLSSNSYIMMCISMIVLLFLFIAVMVWQSYIMRKNVTMKREEIRYQYMIKTQSDYFEGLMKNDAEIRKFRHDMVAHIAALREYANGNNDEKMIEYLSRMEDKVNVTKVKKYTGIKAVDAVINDQIHKMNDKNIKFSYDGFCRNREDLNDFDLCTVFFNLIKNAVEACEKVDSDNRSIHVKVKNIGDKLGISIDNDTILNEIPEDGVLETTKDDKLNHGLGTRSVRDVVERYDGIYVNEIVDGRFVVDIIL